MRIKKISPTTPANGNIENQYGTSQTNAYSEAYQNDHNVVISTTEPSNKSKVWLQHSSNLFKRDEAVITNGYFDSTSGALITGGGSYVTENYTEVEESKTYIVGNVSLARVVFYNSSKTVLSVSTTNTAFTTPANTKYIRIQMTQNSSNIIIQNGSSVIEDKTYILNDNNSYEEFIPQNDVYSTTETKIGTWIDGKPLYRKTFITTSVTTSNTNFITNLGSITPRRIYGILETTSSAKFPMPLTDSSSNYNVIFYTPDDNGSIRGRAVIGSGAFSKAYITIEYTKTTD